MPTGKELTPPPPPLPKVVRLDTLQSVRKELAKVYRDARQKRIDTVAASRLGFLLVSLAKLIEQSEIERRVETLETVLKVEYTNDWRNPKD